MGHIGYAPMCLGLVRSDPAVTLGIFNGESCFPHNETIDNLSTAISMDENLIWSGTGRNRGRN